MTAPVQCWLVHRGRILDPIGFTTLIYPDDPEATTAHLRGRLVEEIRRAEVDPASKRQPGDFCLDYAPLGVPEPPVMTVRLP